MRSYTAAVSSWHQVPLLTLVSLLLCLLVVYTATWGRTDAYFPSNLDPWGHSHIAPVAAASSRPNEGDGGQELGKAEHPIEALMRTAQLHLDVLIAEHSTSLNDAAKKYREKRGRHPPPYFDVWYKFASARNSVIPERFFDQIYHDLNPFWSVEVPTLQRRTSGFSPKITVRNGSVEPSAERSYERVQDVVAMLNELAKEVELPDMDIPVNANDEVAMLVPWETMETTVEFSRKFMPAPKSVVSTFSPTHEGSLGGKAFDPEWLDDRLHRKPGGPYLGRRPLWSLVRPACPPGSSARMEPLMADVWNPEGHTNLEHSVAALLPFEPPNNSSEGYVANWTVASDICKRPDMQGLHGDFVSPKAMSITQKFFPLFSTSKMSTSNEILIPSLHSINASLTSSVPWHSKDAKLHWRGPASGGVNSKLNWRRMHRHRFVSMLNATHVEIAEGMLHVGNESTVGLGYAGNFRLQPGNAYHLTTQKGATMAEWVNGWADASFIDLVCDEPTEAGGCTYTDEFFSIKPENEATDTAKYKYAAVIDGDGGDDFGEFVQHLLEGRVVLRASVYKQWYESRLIPWLHFLPIDNTLVDLYAIMEYFVGTSIASPATEFAHAHVEVEKHEHHFQTPHWDQGDDEKHDVDAHAKNPADLETKRGLEGEDGNKGHDTQARSIAETARDWASKALREEDVLVYMYRLVLEYARVVDEKRHTLGWVDDLIEEEGAWLPEKRKKGTTIT